MSADFSTNQFPHSEPVDFGGPGEVTLGNSALALMDKQIQSIHVTTLCRLTDFRTYSTNTQKQWNKNSDPTVKIVKVLH